MAVLSNIDLQEALKNDEGIIISNMQENSRTGPGYDLTIGFICDADEGVVPEMIFIDNPSANWYCLRPGHRYLIVTREYISFPAHYMATIHARVSYVLKGILFTSTTVDPNFEGFLYISLINCSCNEVRIKEHNRFATMVIHQILTPTKIPLQTNEDGTPKDGQETLNSLFSNICEEAAKRAKIYTTDEFQKLKAEHREAQFRAAQKYQKKLDSMAHAQVLSEKEALDKQQSMSLQAQIDSLREELDESKRAADMEKKKRHLTTLILSIIIAVCLLVLLIYFWGVTIQTLNYSRLCRKSV